MGAVPQDGALGLRKPGGALRQLNRLAACLTSPVKKNTPTAGLEVILGLKPLDLVALESGMADSIRWKPRIRWDGIGFQSTRGHA